MKYICLKEAAKISGYHQDYLGFLIRKGKLNGQKVGRSWMTTKKDLDSFINAESTSIVRDVIFSRFGLSIVVGLILTVIVVVSIFFATQLFRDQTLPVSNYVEDQLNLSAADNLNVFAR